MNRPSEALFQLPKAAYTPALLKALSPFTA